MIIKNYSRRNRRKPCLRPSSLHLFLFALILIGAWILGGVSLYCYLMYL